MNVDQIRSAYLTAVNAGLEITETAAGFVVWAPLFYSDDDGVVLSVYPDGGGWLVSDDGSTVSHLADVGAPVASPAFDTAWSSLSSIGFVPASSARDGAIQAWCSTDDLGEMIHTVAMTALRAEGLSYVRESRGGHRPFSSTVRERVRYQLADHRFTVRGMLAGKGELSLASGRNVKVTETIVRSDGQVCAAVQALAGKSKDTRGQAHDHAFTIFSQSTMAPETKLAVVNHVPEWDAGLIRELGAVSTVVDYNELSDVDKALDTLLARHDLVPPALASTH